MSQYIADIYQEDAESYSTEIHAVETLRSAAYNPSIDVTGCNVIKRYYCQLHSIQNRFPIANDHTLVSFSWPDIYTHNIVQTTNIRHDMAVVLYNYGALHSQLGASADRSTEDEMKLACTHFQCAAWAFGSVRENYAMATSGDLSPELLMFMEQVSYAQAQECILEKGLMDNRKAVIVAKVTAQIIEYYNMAFAALLTGGDEGSIGDVVGSKLFKEWKQYVQFKVQYLSCILFFYQGQHAEEQQKMGERVILYQKACERLEDARKEAKGMDHIQDINDAIAFVADVVEAKRKSAKNENEFIYHEEVPELNTIANVQGANLVKGIAFNMADADCAAEDIFHRLVPIKTHETSSLYSEEKANILRQLNHKIEKKDKELNKFMDSVSIDFLNDDAPATNAANTKLPQPLIDRCADLHAKPNAIPDLISKMSALAEICVDVENSLANIKDVLLQEDQYENDYQQTLGYRPSGHFVELNREFLKYQEAHNKAGESNDTLRKAMELHVNNLKTLSQPLSDLQASIPTCNADLNVARMQEIRHLLKKVNEMRVQRSQLLAQLTENVQKDDITSQLVAWGEQDVDVLFKTELAKHDQLVGIIEQNIVAQGNILKAFTDIYAKNAHVIKAFADAKHNRESFFSSLIASYDVYDDLLSKSLKGLEFYKKLQSNIHKLQSRVRAARDVHDEERQQRLASLNKKSLATAPAHHASIPTANVNRLVNKAEMDTLPPHDTDYSNDHLYNIATRPTPIGQENTAVSSQCVTSAGGGTYANRSIIQSSNHKMDSSAGVHYPYVSYPQPSAHITGNTMGNYVVSQTPTSISTVGDSAPSAYIPQSQPQMQQYDTTSGYLNPIYGGLQNPYMSQRSTTPPQMPSNIGVSQSNVTMGQLAQQPVGHHHRPSTSQHQPIIDPAQSHHPANAINMNQSLPYTQTYGQLMSYATQPDMQYYPQVKHATAQPTYPYSSMGSYPSTVSTVYHANTSLATTPQPSDLSAFHQVAENQSQVTPSLHSYANNPYVTTIGVDNNQSAYGAAQPAANISHYVQQQNVGPYSGVDNSVVVQPTPPYASIASTSAISTASVNAYQYGQSVNSYAAYSQTNYGPENMNAGAAVSQTIGSCATNDYSQVNQNVYYSQVGATQNYMPAQGTLNTTSNANVTAPMLSIADPSNSVNYYYGDNAYMARVQQPSSTVPSPAPSPANTVVNAAPAQIVKKTNIDLLSEFDNFSISAPTLLPMKTDKLEATKIAADKPAELAAVNQTPALLPTVATTVPVVSELPEIPAHVPNVPSLLPESNESTINESLDAIESNVSFTLPIADASKTKSSNDSNPNVSSNLANIENFIKEVQRFEKSVSNMTTKTLNGTTPLDTKWKELHDILVNDARHQ